MERRTNGSTALRAGGKGPLPCQQDDNSQDGQIKKYQGIYLPEDILSHIHSLMPMPEAARVACVSQAFVRSWRCHPNLTFTKETLCLNENAHGKDEMDFTSIVDCILKKHSSVGVKTLHLPVFPDLNDKDCCHLYHRDSWLEIAVTPGIQELILKAYSVNTKYNFPCSVLSDGTVDSLRYFFLAYCDFHPTARLGLRSLTRLQLFSVCITDGELACLLSNSFALEQLKLGSCSEIICLKMPCLERLIYLEVSGCTKLQVIEGKAPKLSRLSVNGDRHVQVSLGETLRIEKLSWSCSPTAPSMLIGFLGFRV